MQMLCAYGVKEVYYRDDYPESEADSIADRYGIQLVQLADYPSIIAELDNTPVPR
jgi:dCMP deaminase